MRQNQSVGLSPCVWGHLLHITKANSLFGSIPMCMGPPTFYSYFAFIAWVYPHVYGATSESSRPCRPKQGLSPCVWGHPLHASQCSCRAGSIPMCMGPPKTHPKGKIMTGVYPHVYVANQYRTIRTKK